MTATRARTKRKIISADYHRNGISGVGFDVAIIAGDPDEGEAEKMLLINFHDNSEAFTAAFDLEKLAEGEIRFLENSWRGDHFTEYMRTTVRRWIDRQFKKRYNS